MLKVKQWLGLSLVIGSGWVCVGVAQDQLHPIVYPNPMPETIEAGCAYHGYDYQGNQTCIAITNTSDQPIGMSNGPVPFETLSADSWVGMYSKNPIQLELSIKNANGLVLYNPNHQLTEYQSHLTCDQFACVDSF